MKKLTVGLTAGLALTIAGACLEGTDTQDTTHVNTQIATEQLVYQVGEQIQLTFPGGNPEKVPEISNEVIFQPPVFELLGAKELYRKPLDFIHRELERAGDRKNILIDYVNALPTQLEMQQLAEVGVLVGDYVQDGVYRASVNAQGLEHLIHEGIRMFEILPEAKIGPRLHGVQDNKGNFQVEVTLSHDSTGEDIDKLVNKYNVQLQARSEQINSFIISIGEEKAADVLNKLIYEDKVRLVNGPTPGLDSLKPIKSFETNVESKDSTGSRFANEFWGLEGEGITVYVHDGGEVDNESHTDLRGRITRANETSIDQHPFHVFCTVMGDGTSSQEFDPELEPNALRGKAPKARGYSDSHRHCNPHCLWETPAGMDEQAAIAVENGAILVNMSIGTNVGPNWEPKELLGDYESSCQVVDGMVLGNQGRELILFVAAGNERGWHPFQYGTLGQPASAKNTITVGAVKHDGSMTDFSSWGPTDDGRTGVLVVAPGENILSCLPEMWGWAPLYGTMSGTSMATPNTTGTGVLIYEKAIQTIGHMSPASMKAVLAQTATDVANPGLDFQSGFGMIWAPRAISQVANKQVLEQVIKNGEFHKYEMLVAPGEDNVKFTLAWADQIGPKFTDKALVNDLDIIVTSPSGNLYLPQVLDPTNPEQDATPGRDGKNNIEQVVVKNPESGLWEVSVRGFEIPQGPQKYSLAFDEATEGRGGSFVSNPTNENQSYNVRMMIDRDDVGAGLGWTEYFGLVQKTIVLAPGERVELRDLWNEGLKLSEAGNYRARVEIDSKGTSPKVVTSEFFVR